MKLQDSWYKCLLASNRSISRRSIDLISYAFTVQDVIFLFSGRLIDEIIHTYCRFFVVSSCFSGHRQNFRTNWELQWLRASKSQSGTTYSSHRRRSLKDSVVFCDFSGMLPVYFGNLAVVVASSLMLNVQQTKDFEIWQGDVLQIR